MTLLMIAQAASAVFTLVVVIYAVRDYVGTKHLGDKMHSVNMIGIALSFTVVFLTLLASLIYVVTQ